MFRKTHTDAAPWTLIKADDKMRARINAMRHVLHVLPYEGKDESVAHQADPLLVASSDEVYGASTSPLTVAETAPVDVDEVRASQN